MNKHELLIHMQTALSEVIKQDEQAWRELEGLLEQSEIDLDKAWHNGYASAIQTVTEMLDGN